MRPQQAKYSWPWLKLVLSFAMLGCGQKSEVQPSAKAPPNAPVKPVVQEKSKAELKAEAQAAEKRQAERERLTKPEEGGKRILFVGNSFTYVNDLPGLVALLAKESGHPRPLCESITIPGAALEDHWPNASTKTKIRNGPWDYVIFQQGPSSLTKGQQMLLDSMRQFAPLVAEGSGRPALYMVWPEQNRRLAFVGVHRGYLNAAKEVDGIFLPAGDAWSIVLNAAPDINLYGDDQLHPTEIGTYLAGSAIVSTLYDVPANKFPTKVEWGGRYHVDLAADKAKILHDAVNQAIKDNPKAPSSTTAKKESDSGEKKPQQKAKSPPAGEKK